jgi:two-component system NtrC family response regulator
MERLVVTVMDDVIRAESLPSDLGPAANSPSNAPERTLGEVIEEAEKDAIGAALAASDYHREQTAKLLGISVRTLHYKMSRYGLH